VRALLWPIQCHPTIRIVGRFPFSPELANSEYRHRTVALHQHFYSGSVRIGREQFALEPGDVTVTPPDAVSRYEIAKKGYHWCVHFQPVDVGVSGAMFRLPLHIPRAIAGETIPDEFRFLSDAIFQARNRRKGKPLYLSLASARLQSLLLRLGTRPNARAVAATPRSTLAVEAAKTYIDAHLCESLEVCQLALRSGLSPSYFAERFRERFRVTVDRYILQRRIEMARVALGSTMRSIKEIGADCGIPDPHYFNKQFRRITGESPSAFRSRERPS